MILVTGGSGYIGSHTCVALLQTGYEVIVLDNLSNSKTESIHRVESITGRKVTFIQGDVRDRHALQNVFSTYKIDGVIHFAGLKAVGESVEKPLLYYENNVSGSIILAEVMAEFGVKTLVFSSSATVYGEPENLPFIEHFPPLPSSPYANTKVMVEHILTDVAHTDSNWRIALLRYFNPVGAHESGHIGEDPNGVPNNLMPFISQVAVGRRELLNIWGNDYPTHDGTGVRDYIHVMDLADGHVKALSWLKNNPGSDIINLGTGHGYSVLDMVKAFERISGQNIPYRIAPRRAGDVAQMYADASKARKLLDWKAERNLETMCADAWRWQVQNPQGYE